jgi:hypothetical protein
MKGTALIACGVWLACPAPAAAHRLDEYLQATRIALAPDNVGVEIDLTPGMHVASKVVTLIDSNGDGALSLAERQAYAALVVTLTDLKVDGVPAPLILVASEYPPLDEMRAGVGTIHLTGRATLPPMSPGPHELTYVNVHHAEMSAYLVNALDPPSGTHITNQRRDPWQHQLVLDYVIESDDRTSRVASGFGVATLMMCALAWFRRTAVLRVSSTARWW